MEVLRLAWLLNGAEMIEKHVKYGNAKWATDSVALDLKKNEYGLFYEDIKKTLVYCGSSKKRINQRRSQILIFGL